MKKILILFLVAFALQVQAQNWELGLTGGLTMYQGDIVEPAIDFGNGRLTYGLFLQRNFNERAGLRLGFNLGQFAADDRDYDRYVEGSPALKLETNYSQLHLRFDYNLMGRHKNFYNANGEKLSIDEIMDDKIKLYDNDGELYSIDVERKRKWTPYVFGAPNVTLLNENLRTQDLEGLESYTGPVNEQLKTSEDQVPSSVFGVTVGVGINIYIGENMKLGFEYGLTSVFNDYLDGVSQIRDPESDDIYSNFMIKVSTSLAPKDTDGDGILDKNDKCPDVPGLEKLKGCPDSDGDGVTDRADKCPEIPGLRSLRGCPDSDEDGIADKDDDCPKLAGTEELNGCPDSDGDGVIDPEDNCPNLVGPANLAGCPDSDGDGIIDNRDDCPDVPGVPALNGCPDSDGDGITDADDKCPKVKGEKDNNGCPKEGEKVVVEKEDQEVLDYAMENIEFKTNSDVLKNESIAILNQVGTVLNKYPKLSVRISGHTDSDGNADYNLKLSEKRAKMCLDYLYNTSKVELSRMSFAGYGETQPIDSNDTKEGKQMNRRVEFILE